MPIADDFRQESLFQRTIYSPVELLENILSNMELLQGAQISPVPSRDISISGVIAQIDFLQTDIKIGGERGINPPRVRRYFEDIVQCIEILDRWKRTGLEGGINDRFFDRFSQVNLPKSFCEWASTASEYYPAAEADSLLTPEGIERQVLCARQNLDETISTLVQNDPPLEVDGQIAACLRAEDALYYLLVHDLKDDTPEPEWKKFAYKAAYIYARHENIRKDTVKNGSRKGGPVWPGEMMGEMVDYKIETLPYGPQMSKIFGQMINIYERDLARQMEQPTL